MSFTPDELHSIAHKLEEIKKNILYQLAELEKEADFGSDVDHGEEEADESEEFVNQLDLQRNLKMRLESVERALDKIREGTYGTCEKCGKPIEQEVLNVDPESRYCKSCKENT